MLDVGFSEILLTSLIALIVLGPERLPKVARQVGHWMGRARSMTRQLSEQLEREVNAEELLKIQGKTASNANSAKRGAADDPAPIPVTAPLPETAPHVAAARAAETPTEPTYGLPATSTTAAAMHPPEQPAADLKPPYE